MCIRDRAYPAAADDFLPYVGKAGNMSALRQFCLIVAAIFRFQLCYSCLLYTSRCV